MRTRNNKLINFILEFTQILLVFLGVFSALMCSATSLDLTFHKGLCTLLMLLAAILFYGLFSVLETFRKGKLYGIIGITIFIAFIVFRFREMVFKGGVAIINSFLKQFMNFTGTEFSLVNYKGQETATLSFCTTFLIILLGVYLTVIISAFFYRRRRSFVFVLGTAPFVLLPLCIGRLGYFSNLFTYLMVAMTIVGTRHLRTDATDRRMRQKLSIVMLVVGLVAGGVSYAFIPPQRYERNTDKIVELKNTMLAITTWSGEDLEMWVKSHLNESPAEFGKIGKKEEVVYSGNTILKISGTVNETSGLYLKGYVGDIYKKNKWSSVNNKEEYKKDFETLDASGITPENWHLQIRNDAGQSVLGQVWQTGKLRIRNIGFGYGNYLVPYLPTGVFKTKDNGHITIDSPGIDYTVEYYLQYSQVMQSDFLQNKVSIGNNAENPSGIGIWEYNMSDRMRLFEFAEKYYLQVPASLKEVCSEFKTYLKKKDGNLLKAFEEGKADQSDIVEAVKNYITKDTEYTLAPGETPAGKETVEYFLNENKKGYCTYYATTAAMLLRSVGIPTRYVEGVYVSAEELEKGLGENEIEVKDSNCHAWIEVFDKEYGFVPIEVTPGMSEQQGGASQDTPKDSDSPDNKNGEEPDDGDSQNTEEPEIVTPTPAVSEMPQDDMVFDDIDGNEDPEEETASGGAVDGTGNSKTKKIVGIVVKILFGIFVFAIAMEVQRRLRRYLFKRSLQSQKMKKRIRMVYMQLQPIWLNEGVHYHGQTMEEYTKEVAMAMSMDVETIGCYVRTLFYARFGPDDMTDEQFREFHKIYEEMRRKIYKDAKPIKKLYYMYIMAL